MEEQLRALETMPLTKEELDALKWARSSILTYGTMFSVVGAFCGISMTASTSRLLHRMTNGAIFASIGGLLGISFGMQRGFHRISNLRSNLSLELEKLETLRRARTRTGNMAY